MTLLASVGIVLLGSVNLKLNRFRQVLLRRFFMANQIRQYPVCCFGCNDYLGN
jgi:hypothetical protein